MGGCYLQELKLVHFGHSYVAATNYFGKSIVDWGIKQIYLFFFYQTTYYAVPKSFETKKFCYKSMHRGMILNFMIPICLLLILTTVYAISAMIKIENLEVAKLDYHYQSESMNNKELDSLNVSLGNISLEYKI